MSSFGHCESTGCSKPAKLQCPSCIKLGIQGSFFCSQECFKSNWKSHKIIHTLVTQRKARSLKLTNWNEWTVTSPTDIPRQVTESGHDGGNCGVHVCVWGYMICSGSDFRFKEEHMNYARRGIATPLVTCPEPKANMERLENHEMLMSSFDSSPIPVNLEGDDVVQNKDSYNPWPQYNYTGKLRPFPQTSKRTVPLGIGRPDYADHPQGFPLSEQAVKGSGVIKILDEEEIEGMRVACKLGREVLDEAARVCEVGVTTDEIDRVVHEACIERDCYPSPLNYYEFPKSCCTSVNEVICHGIPDMRPLKDGDLCNVDITVYHHNFHGDLNETFFVGEVSERHKNLVKVTYECLMKAIEIVKPGEKYREIGNVIQKHAQAHGYSVVRSYCGHGIHRLFHTAPNVPHYAKNRAVGVIKPGHCFTIEPMISEGTWRDEMWPDKWTAVTADGQWSAQFEQTLLVNENGCEILTRRRKNSGQPHFMDKM